MLIHQIDRSIWTTFFMNVWKLATTAYILCDPLVIHALSAGFRVNVTVDVLEMSKNDFRQFFLSFFSLAEFLDNTFQLNVYFTSDTSAENYATFLSINRMSIFFGHILKNFIKYKINQIFILNLLRLNI